MRRAGNPDVFVTIMGHRRTSPPVISFPCLLLPIIIITLYKFTSQRGSKLLYGSNTGRTDKTLICSLAADIPCNHASNKRRHRVKVHVGTPRDAAERLEKSSLHSGLQIPNPIVVFQADSVETYEWVELNVLKDIRRYLMGTSKDQQAQS